MELAEHIGCAGVEKERIKNSLDSSRCLDVLSKLYADSRPVYDEGLRKALTHRHGL